MGLGQYASPTLIILALSYFFSVAFGLWLSVVWKVRFNGQLSIQVFADVVAASLVIYLVGGVGSGFPVLLLISLAAASLVGHGRLVLLYAAVATLAVLLAQAAGIVAGRFEQATIVPAGLFGAAFFATALLARLLGQRVMLNEELARRRGEDLSNQIIVSQRVVECVQDGVLIVHRDGRITGVNPVAREMLGLPVVPGGYLGQCFPDLYLALSGASDSHGSMGVSCVTPGGRELIARFEQTASSAGETLVLLEDPGLLRERAQQLKLASLGRLTASIAHEIRNPLAAISHAGELLQEEGPADLRARLLRILGDNVRRLDRIVGDVLQLGRQNPPVIEVINLGECCHGIATDMVSAEQIADRCINSQFSEPITLCFDRSHLYQVLTNLLGNALRYCSRTEGCITLSAIRFPEDGRVELHVKDDGPGVPVEIAEHIFEPFFTTFHHGTGLGLYIARELCAANGAMLEMRATLKGAHFVLLGRSDTCPPAEAIDVRVQT